MWPHDFKSAAPITNGYHLGNMKSDPNGPLRVQIVDALYKNT